MKKLFLLLTIGFISTFSLGQQSEAPSSFGVNDPMTGGGHRYKSIPPKGEISYEEALREYENFDGSPFLHNGDLKVDLIAYNDSVYKSVTILYDLFNQELMVRPEKEEIIILDQIHYKGFIYNHKGVKEKYMRVQPLDVKFYNILFQNEDFIFCKLDHLSVSEDTRYIPGQESKKKKFVSRTKYYISDKKEINEVYLKNELVVNRLPNKYKSQIYKIKNKLNIKKLKKEKDYLLLMNEF